MTRWVLIGTVLVIVAVFVFVPPVHQSEAYHRFADQRTLFGIPNFWNVVSNLAFFAVVLYGIRAFRGQFGYAVVLIGAVLVGIGSGYYHWNPTDATLVWDRLPMTLVFMAIFATIIGSGLLPLLAAGVLSIGWWVATGDLRLYGIVQYLPVLVIPVLLAFRRGVGWLWGMCGLYLLAKVLELGDGWIGRFLTTGGHPWKHVAAAGALLCFCRWELVRSIDKTWRGSV